MPRTEMLGTEAGQDAHLVRGLSRLLGEFTLDAQGSELPVETCAEHLALLGVAARYDRAASPSQQLRLKSKSCREEAGRGEVCCTIRWGGMKLDERTTPQTESLVQAISGLMEVHGRDTGRPRRLGLDVASVASGIFATQGLLAALIARNRGSPIRAIETSVLHGALFFLCQHLAIATCGREFPFRSQESAPGPPFRTADGHWIELEILSVDIWIAFWAQLGIPQALLERAWPSYLFRYLTAKCKLPEELHQAASRHTVAELRCISESCGVALCRLRKYQEILRDAGWCSREKDASEVSLGTPWAIRQGTEPGATDCFPHPYTAVAGKGPLAGLRVVEVTSRLQGPLASLLLSMLGAEVIKVEPPGGDIGRAAPSGPLRAGYSAFNRGKRVVELNYKPREGRGELLQLIQEADVFLHNWRVGRAEQLGLDFEALSLNNPRLVYAHASGWGKNGNEPSSIAGDFLVQAHAGCGDGLNPHDELPVPSRLAIIDVLGGLLACEGILIGLYLRERTGRGSCVDTSLLGAAMTLQSSILRGIASGKERNRSWGRPTWGLLDRPLETADGFLMIAAEGKRIERQLAEICGIESMADEQVLELRIIEQMRCRPAVEWEQRMQDEGIPAAVVCSALSSLPDNPQVKALLEQTCGSWVPRAPWEFRT